LKNISVLAELEYNIFSIILLKTSNGIDYFALIEVQDFDFAQISSHLSKFEKLLFNRELNFAQILPILPKSNKFFPTKFC